MCLCIYFRSWNSTHYIYCINGDVVPRKSMVTTFLLNLPQYKDLVRLRLASSEADHVNSHETICDWRQFDWEVYNEVNIAWLKS